MNTWDERYSGADFYDGQQPCGCPVEQAQGIRPGGQLLCLVEGEGRNAAQVDLAHWPMPPGTRDAIVSIWCHRRDELRGPQFEIGLEREAREVRGNDGPGAGDQVLARRPDTGRTT